MPVLCEMFTLAVFMVPSTSNANMHDGDVLLILIVPYATCLQARPRGGRAVI